MCEKDNCPKCETVCSPANCRTSCVAPDPVCTPMCEETKCDWKCKKPSTCPKPKCELQCERPACEAPPPAPTPVASLPAGCCACNQANVQASITAATTGASLIEQEALPSLLEVMNSIKFQEKNGEQKCCACAQ